MTALTELTLVELSEALHARRASAVELMQQVLERVDTTNEMLHAVCALRDRDALAEEARRADERLARGEGRPLEGIPLGVKDLEHARGLPTVFGSRLYGDAQPAEDDSIQVARLREAGAIVVAKTNTPEMGFTAITKNLVFGTTHSPWDPARSPGGSSGGSAALIAAEVLPLCTASDGGGSIRIPASFTGTFGLKPSYGRVPRGPLDLWDHVDTAVLGPLTKTVEDAALVLDHTAGPHPLDPKSLPPSGLSYLEVARTPIERKLRFALSLDLGYAAVQSEVAARVEEAARTFETLGHRVEAIAGGPPEMGGEWGLLLAYHLGGELELAGKLRGRESEVTRALMRGIDLASGVTRHWWAETARRRALVVRWCAELFERFDALLTPTVPFEPPPARGPLPVETEGKPQPVASAGSFTIPFNLSWHPACSVRAGLTRAGLPVGMQIVAPHHREDLLLRIARAYERERPWHPRWPLR